jgi:3-oxoacyl-[acyl-carrier-protein] synthase II
MSLVTGIGTINTAFAGGADALAAWLRSSGPLRASPETGLRGPSPRAKGGDFGAPPAAGGAVPLERWVEEEERRRLSRVCQLTVAAARLALGDAGLGPGVELGLVLGTEFGDLGSTVAFADGYLDGGPAGLSALRFPNTVMNTMAAAATIAVGARERSLTLNAGTVAGELGPARAAAGIAGGRTPRVLAGGADQIEPLVAETLRALGGAGEAHGEGATLLVLESRDAALARGARVLGEIAAAAWRSFPVRPHGVGGAGSSRAIPAALTQAGVDARAIGWVYASRSGDQARDAWEARLLDAALAPHRPPRAALRPLLGAHAGTGALAVAAAILTARTGRLPGPEGAQPVEPGCGLVYAVSRGGSEVALVVR